jgi:hypothetical protein
MSIHLLIKVNIIYILFYKYCIYLKYNKLQPIPRPLSYDILLDFQRYKTLFLS